MKRKKIKRILISTMATAMLATLTFGVASLSVKAETTPNYFKATGGSYTMTDPNVAYTKADGSTGAGSSGVKIHVTPSVAGEDVKLTLQGAHKRYVGASWWGGSLRYRMDDTNASAVIATYRSNIDQEYAISFIMTSAGTYVSLTDDVVFENGIPYMDGSTVPMDIDLANTKKVADSNHALIDFRPTVTHKQAPGAAISTNEMFKEVNNAFSSFSLTDAAIVEDEKAAASEAYAYRYTQEWIEQLLADLSYNDSILELTFVDVAAQGTILSLLELNGYNYAGIAKAGWNSDPMTTFQAPKPLVVQKTTSMKFDGTNIVSNLNDYWEVWDYSADGGKKDLTVFKSINTCKNKNYDFSGGTVAGSTGHTGLIGNGYHVLRPGLIGGPTAYYYMYLSDTTNYPSYFYGRFDLMSKLNVSVNGSTKVIYVPAWTDFTLADYEWDNCPISATGAIAGSASKTYGTNDAINVKDYIGQTLTLTLGAHTEVTIPGYPATTSTPGLTDGKYCSACGKVLSVGEEIPVLATDKNFWTDGGMVKMTNPSIAYTKADGTEGAASSGVKIHVIPNEDGGNVTLTLKGAHQRYIGSSWWGGSLRYRMDDTNASAVIATYRSNVDQEYAISFIMTAKGTYVSLTDDVEFKNGVPYILGSNIAMSVDLLNTKMLANNNTHALLDFRPTTSRAVNAAYSTNEMFKEVNNAFSSFSLTDASIIAAEKAAVSEEYAYRYTQEWIEQLLSDLSYNDSILELTFVDVAEQGTILNLLELNGYNYADLPKASWNSEPMDTFQAPKPLIVQKSTEMHMSASNQAMELDTYWEVWDVDSENGKASMPQRITVSGTNYDTTINTYTDKYSTQKATTSGLNKLLSNGYNAFRPGLMKQSLVYYRLVPFASHSSSQYTPVYGRINVMSNLNVTVNGVKETVWVPVCTNFTLADYEWDGCPISATGAIAGAASKTYGAKDAITVKDYFGQSLTVTLGEHNQVQVGGVAATCTEDGLTGATVCSQCDKLFQKSTVIPATGHNEVDGTAKEPTLIEAGHTAGTYCSTCDIPMVAQEVIPARVDQADFRTLDVASARIDTVSGLRFTTYIEKTIYDELINAGHTLTFYTEITTINSSKKVTIAIDNEKIFEQDGYYCFNSVLGTILPQNYTRVFFADSFMVIDGDVKTVKALTVAEREGRSYAQIITAALNDISDTETETATYFWDGKWHGLSKTAYSQAEGINAAIEAEEVTPIITYEASVADALKEEIIAWFESLSLKIGDSVNYADLISSISLSDGETLGIIGEGANGIVTDRGLNITISVRPKEKIIDNGISDYVIVYGSDVTSYPATELQYEMSNSMATAYAMPYQLDNGTANKSKVISIGSTAYAEEAGVTSPEAVGITKEDGFIIKSFGDSYIIYGGSAEGNLYGTYEFLRQVFGMEFLSQTAQKYYPANEFVYAEPINFVSNPDFDTRDYYGHIVSQGYASTGATFGFNSPFVRADGRITNTTDEDGKYTTYGGKYFRYYYGAEDADKAYGSQVSTASIFSVAGHTVSDMLAADAAKTLGFTYGDKVDIGGGNMWMAGWEQVNPSWYAYDPGYTTRIAARNNAATDMQISLGSVPNQVMNYDNQWNQSYYGRAAMEICWTNGLTLENGNYVYKAGSADATGSVIEKLISLCMEMIRDPKNSEAVYLELGFYDWYVECQCEKCLAAYKKFGGSPYSYSYEKVTGTYLWDAYKRTTVNATSYWGGFGGVVANAVNEIAKACKAQMANDNALKDREVKFVTLGYQRAIQAPVNLTLDEDVCVRMCWRNCASHPINAVNSVCTHNQQQLAAVEAWNAIAGEILIWDYTINFVDYLYYIPNYDAMKANYQYYKSIGVTQVLTQSAPWDWNFYESVLHQYVASKLMWNTELDVDTIINDFDRMYFGEYASVVANYRSIMDTMYETQNIHANTWGALDFANNSKFDASVLNNAIAALRPSIEALEARLQYDENGEVVKNQDYYYYSRLLSVIITPQYMLIDLGLVEGDAREGMLSELKENTAFIGLIRTRESGTTFADMV